MSKIRTLDQLQRVLDDDFAWRLKEIHLLKRIAEREEEHNRQACVRANVVMLYAHWEGFVKTCAESYLRYVTAQKILLCDLSDNFVALCVRRNLNLFETRSLADDCRAVSEILDSLRRRAHVPTEGQVRTKSNLKYKVFVDICTIVGIDPAPYSTREKMIDSSLVDARNEVAHGRYLGVQLESLQSLCDAVLELMRNFKDDVSNAAAQGKYKRRSASS